MRERRLINGKGDLKVKDINEIKCKYCPKCDTYKPMTSEYYHKNKNLSTGFDSYCKECKKNNKYERYVEFNLEGNLYCLRCKTYKPISEFRDTPSCNPIRSHKDTYCLACREYVSNPLQVYIDKIIYDCLYTKEKYRRDYNVTITTEDVINLYETQKHKCILTGLELTYSKDTLSTNISIDRINPGKDYSLPNIRLVCTTVNIMRNAMSDEEFINWCNLVVLFNNKQ